MLDQAITDAVTGVTAKWAKQRKAEERSTRSERNRAYAFRPARDTIKDAAAEVMVEAYLKASANGRLPANARQIMYAARPHIQERTGEPLNDAYFTQTLLPDYLEAHDVAWDVVYDARGTFHEPHTRKSVALGTVAVRTYLRAIAGHRVDAPGVTPLSSAFPTEGPANRFGGVLFIEKEGFAQILAAANIAERFDIAIMSTKGVSVTASRQLVERLGVPTLVLHDFDQVGFSIIGTLRRSTRRYHFRGTHQVIDLGLTLADIKRYGLEAEYQKLTQNHWTLRRNGASAADIAFLAQDQRVELNMLASDELVDLVETRLVANGIRKVVPDADQLRSAYRRAYEVALLKDALEAAAEAAHERALALDADEIDDLTARLPQRLEANPVDAWDDVLAALAAATLDEQPADQV